MQFLLRVLIYAVALWVTSLVVSGIHITAVTKLRDLGTLLLVALIFSLVNGFIKPIVQMLGCALYILTLGLFALVANALLFLLTEWFAELLHLPFRIDGFWAAFWGAIVMSIVSWVLSLVLPGGGKKSDA
ncbi:phage holin family protein [Stackebrandtia nassauensis]|uniref:Phage holin family protein n=1 Tax=Stackebrandtia nassauensis (strain DSM 44728 / CIP 108903 / NRRL B-16338 / NBRC 102104 / LLR-40K-21) TaxID=446470 RepID=D3Q237_STANL|nr:phage holin family protein [Stackebrandtia nassauensis]ADD41904.1 membrane protein of unknown function [Stackebrandtia nassauensis DSM 44728]